MHIDFKMTIWERFEIPTELEVEVVEKFKSKELETGDDLFNWLTEKLGVYNDNNRLDDTEEHISLEDNDEFSTVEILIDPREWGDKMSASETVWQNGK